MASYAQNPEEVVKRQVPLHYLLQALGHDSKEDVVMKLAPFETDIYALPIDGVPSGTRTGSPMDLSSIFAILLLEHPELFNTPDAAMDPTETTRQWLDDAQLRIAETCRRSKRALKSQAYVRELFKNKSFQSNDFFLFMAFLFDTSIAVFDVVRQTTVLFNSMNKSRCIVLLNINGHFEAWFPKSGTPNFLGCAEYNRVVATSRV